jgi:hypothetical protein
MPAFDPFLPPVRSKPRDVNEQSNGYERQDDPEHGESYPVGGPSIEQDANQSGKESHPSQVPWRAEAEPAYDEGAYSRTRDNGQHLDKNARPNG